jgi:hypothetical protein
MWNLSLGHGKRQWQQRVGLSRWPKKTQRRLPVLNGLYQAKSWTAAVADFQTFEKSNIPVKAVHRSSRLIMTPRMTPSSAAHPVTISASRQCPLAATSMAINGGAKKGPMLPT